MEVFLFIIFILLLLIYASCMAFVLAFSAMQATLLYYYLKDDHVRPESPPLLDWPAVSIHLPMYNEALVVERLLENILKTDYPEDKMEIVILDDSTDETSGIIENFIGRINSKVRIIHHTRENRNGFKAGALQEGLNLTSAEFIAVFDADFLPAPDFLKKAIASFSAPEIGMAQARWTHINRNYSFITSFQAFTLDAHFTIEQTARSCAGLFMNFNGTAGIWRRRCIEDSGGWQSDTLNEDIDLSFRAQLNGWKFIYLKDLNAPAELPPFLETLRPQQKRWSKGSAEVAMKLVNKLIKKPLPAFKKYVGLIHLFSSLLFVSLFISAFVSVPLLFLKFHFPASDIVFKLLSCSIISAFVLIPLYYISERTSMGEQHSPLKFPLHFISFLSFSIGLSFQNSIAALEGIAGKKSEFVRTPKFNVATQNSLLKASYKKNKFPVIVICEMILFIYFMIGLIAGTINSDYTFVPFHMLVSTGLATLIVFTCSEYFKKETAKNKIYLPTKNDNKSVC